MRRMEPGDEITTVVAAVSGGCVFLDLNAKSEGVLDAAEVTDKDGNITVKEGDTIKAFFLKEEDGEMRFTVKITGGQADKNLLEKAYRSKIPVDGYVEKEIKGGYEVKIGETRAFCPYSQMGFRQKKDAASYIGKQLTFMIQEYKNDGRNILVSNRAIQESAYADHLNGLQKTLSEGMTVTGTVMSLQSFGAFVDIQGFQALLPISEISRNRIEDISTVLSPGQEITAKIIRADWQNERVSLSVKALLADPWDTAAANYPAGTKHEGTVSKVTEYGIFVTLEPGLDGLVHISELPDATRNTNLRKRYNAGDKMTVTVKSVDTEQKRLSLQPAVTDVQAQNAQEYMESQADDGETYNPFAALLKKK